MRDWEQPAGNGGVSGGVPVQRGPLGVGKRTLIDTAFGAATSTVVGHHAATQETAHVVQQRAGVQLKGGIGTASDPHEQHADQVADRVVAGRSAEDLLDAYTSGANETPGAVQRKPATETSATSPATSTPTSASNGNQLAYLLAAPSQPGLADPVVAYLDGLPTPRVLDELNEAIECGHALQLEPRLALSPHLTAALQAAELARLIPITTNHPALQRAGAALDQVSRDQQLQILSWMLQRRGASIEATTLVEGVLAIRSGAHQDNASGAQRQPGPGAAPSAEPTLGQNIEAAVASVNQTAAGAPVPIEPGPWEPPGDQPIPFYIGNEAHRAIAEEYRGAHPADRVATNTSPISSIFSGNWRRRGIAQIPARLPMSKADACRISPTCRGCTCTRSSPRPRRSPAPCKRPSTCRSLPARASR
jgi:hypothetical protein